MDKKAVYEQIKYDFKLSEEANLSLTSIFTVSQKEGCLKCPISCFKTDFNRFRMLFEFFVQGVFVYSPFPSLWEVFETLKFCTLSILKPSSSYNRSYLPDMVFNNKFPFMKNILH